MLKYKNMSTLIMPLDGYKNTTVHFPVNVLRGLRQYIVKHDLSFHDQSKVVSLALRKFLESDGIPIDPDEAMICFEVCLKDQTAKL
jgi:hypothetical protein